MGEEIGMNSAYVLAFGLRKDLVPEDEDYPSKVVKETEEKKEEKKGGKEEEGKKKRGKKILLSAIGKLIANFQFKKCNCF
jgi:hypothetical protein